MSIQILSTIFASVVQKKLRQRLAAVDWDLVWSVYLFRNLWTVFSLGFLFQALLCSLYFWGVWFGVCSYSRHRIFFGVYSGFCTCFGGVWLRVCIFYGIWSWGCIYSGGCIYYVDWSVVQYGVLSERLYSRVLPGSGLGPILSNSLRPVFTPRSSLRSVFMLGGGGSFTFWLRLLYLFLGLESTYSGVCICLVTALILESGLYIYIYFGRHAGPYVPQGRVAQFWGKHSTCKQFFPSQSLQQQPLLLLPPKLWR